MLNFVSNKNDESDIKTLQNEVVSAYLKAHFPSKFPRTSDKQRAKNAVERLYTDAKRRHKRSSSIEQEKDKTIKKRDFERTEKVLSKIEKTQIGDKFKYSFVPSGAVDLSNFSSNPDHQTQKDDSLIGRYYKSCSPLRNFRYHSNLLNRKSDERDSNLVSTGLTKKSYATITNYQIFKSSFYSASNNDKSMRDSSPLTIKEQEKTVANLQTAETSYGKSPGSNIKGKVAEDKSSCSENENLNKLLKECDTNSILRAIQKTIIPAPSRKKQRKGATKTLNSTRKQIDSYVHFNPSQFKDSDDPCESCDVDIQTPVSSNRRIMKRYESRRSVPNSYGLNLNSQMKNTSSQQNLLRKNPNREDKAHQKNEITIAKCSTNETGFKRKLLKSFENTCNSSSQPNLKHPRVRNKSYSTHQNAFTSSNMFFTFDDTYKRNAHRLNLNQSTELEFKILPLKPKPKPHKHAQPKKSKPKIQIPTQHPKKTIEFLNQSSHPQINKETQKPPPSPKPIPKCSKKASKLHPTISEEHADTRNKLTDKPLSFNVSLSSISDLTSSTMKLHNKIQSRRLDINPNRPPTLAIHYNAISNTNTGQTHTFMNEQQRRRANKNRKGGYRKVNQGNQGNEGNQEAVKEEKESEHDPGSFGTLTPVVLTKKMHYQNIVKNSAFKEYSQSAVQPFLKDKLKCFSKLSKHPGDKALAVKKLRANQ